jgi:hypothetical protein
VLIYDEILLINFRVAESMQFEAGVTKKCTLPLDTLIFVCSTFRYTFYTFTLFSQIYTRARGRDHVKAQFHTYTHN